LLLFFSTLQDKFSEIMQKQIYFFFLLLLGSLTAVAQPTYDCVVSLDGTGDYTSIQAAITAVRDFRPEGRYVILIKKGQYKEKIEIPTHKTQITLLGEHVDSTIITWDDHANINKMGTFKTYTLLIRGNDIVLQNLTVENNAAQLGQAVALHVEGDRVSFVNCRFLGNQDTIYLGREGSRAWFNNCYIEGTTDFIFGPSTAWFEACHIHGKRNSYITAASTPSNIEYGFIFNNCTITTGPDVTSLYLGRPWRAFAMTLFMNCTLPATIHPAGWDNWRNPDNERTARYGEYNNSGPGAEASKRVDWTTLWSRREATALHPVRVFDPWNPMCNCD
jgi:pectinesterase